MKAKMGADNNDEGPADHIRSILNEVKKARPYFSFLTQNWHDSEDLSHDVLVKLLDVFAEDPARWDEIGNKSAYVKQTGRFHWLDGFRKKPKNLDSIDDDACSYLLDILSDGNSGADETIELVDYASVRKKIAGLRSTFSEFDWEIIELNFSEGVKPKPIAKLLAAKHSGKTEAEILVHCNVVMANFRYRLEKAIGGNKKPDRSKSKGGKKRPGRHKS